MRSVLFVILSVFFLSCSGNNKISNNLVSGSIPGDIKDSRYVLLVQRTEGAGAGHVNNMAENQMKKYYKGRYEFIDAKDIMNNPKYADKSVYRYVVKENTGEGFAIITTHQGPPDASYGPSRIDYHDQIIYDRKEDKVLRATGLMAHNYAQGIMFFAKATNLN